MSGYRLKPHDLVWGGLSLLFALFSLLWPGTGSYSLGGAALARGYLMAIAYVALASLSFIVPFAESRIPERSRATAWGRLAAFVRTYYPQAFIALFFTDAILLSAQALGGYSHDDFFAAADQAIFGYQPAREFARSLGSRAWINELMFGSYFAYFAFMVITIWIPYMKGDREEGERQLFAICATVAVVCTWYVFFRVQGPKYWLPDLKDAWYDDIKGGLFVSLFQHSLANATLSGAAFPSTHVYLTVTTLFLAFRNDKRFFAVYLPFAFLIICATVYIFAHWATDILGGLLVAMTLPPLFYRLYGRADRLSLRLTASLASRFAARPGLRQDQP